MGSKRRGRRRTRLSRGFWYVFWLTALSTVIVVGLYTSSLTQIVSVRVVSSKSDDWERLRAIVKAHETKPAVTISAYEIERKIESDPRVFESEFSANVFGRARVRVKYREPIALLASDPSYGIDIRGHIFPVSNAESKLLALRIKVQDFSPNLTVADPSPLREAVVLARKLQVAPVKLAGIIATDASGRLTLAVPDGLQIVFGSATRLDEKLKALEAALSADAQLVRSNAVLNLVEPTAPAIKRLNEQ